MWKSMLQDPVVVGSILSVVIAIVILVYLVWKIRVLMNESSSDGDGGTK